MKKEDCIPGVVYCATVNNDGQYLFKFNDVSLSNLIGSIKLNSGMYSNGGRVSNVHHKLGNIMLASPEETIWFNICEAAGKTISFEEANLPVPQSEQAEELIKLLEESKKYL